MQGESRYDTPGRSRASQFGPPQTFPEPNVPGPSRGGYPRSHIHDTPQGTTHSAYGGTYPQAPVSPWPQPGIPVRYDMSQASQQPRMGRSSRSEYSAQSANEPHSPRPLGFVRPQNPGSMTAASSPGYAGVQNALGQSYSRQLANEPHSPYPFGFVRPQNPDPMTAVPHQGHAGVQNALGGSYARQSANEPHSPHPIGFIHTLNPGPMTAIPSRGPVGVQNSFGQYSTGRTMVIKKRKALRRALCIGINYSQHRRHGFVLKKCIEDAFGIANFLRDHLGFAHDDVRVMTDETPWDLPTKENILGAMRTLVNDAQPGDSFFVYFSGHGVQIKDTNGDERDGLDECICAMDYLGNVRNPDANTPGLIVDDVMHEILVQRLPRGCRLFAMFDSCHSGTVLDLPYIYNSNGVVKPINHPDRLWLLRQKASYADVVSLSASKDNQRAFETRRGGALRWAFIECVGTSDNTLTYRELLRAVREYMIRHQFPQRPQLSSSYEIDTNMRFIT